MIALPVGHNGQFCWKTAFLPGIFNGTFDHTISLSYLCRKLVSAAPTTPIKRLDKRSDKPTRERAGKVCISLSLSHILAM